MYRLERVSRVLGHHVGAWREGRPRTGSIVPQVHPRHQHAHAIDGDEHEGVSFEEFQQDLTNMSGPVTLREPMHYDKQEVFGAEQARSRE